MSKENSTVTLEGNLAVSYKLNIDFLHNPEIALLNIYQVFCMFRSTQTLLWECILLPYLSSGKVLLCYIYIYLGQGQNCNFSEWEEPPSTTVTEYWMSLELTIAGDLVMFITEFNLKLQGQQCFYMRNM